MNSTSFCRTVTIWLFWGLVLTVAPIPGVSFAQENGESLSSGSALALGPGRSGPRRNRHGEPHGEAGPTGSPGQIDDLFLPHPLPGTTASTTTLYLGEERVWVHVHESPTPGLTFVNIHDDENTALEAAKLYIRDHGGRLVELRHGRGRTVVIRRNGVLDRFDPNRMFTENGLRHSLYLFGTLSDENYAPIADFARKVAGFISIEKGKAIISVHNNTPGKLTIHDFKPGQWYGRDSREVFINPAEDPDNFFFTNSPVLFRALKTLRYNVVLMVPDPPDRGTLGNYVNNAGGIYVLVEAEHGHLSSQVRMLENLGRLLGGDSPAGN